MSIDDDDNVFVEKSILVTETLNYAPRKLHIAVPDKEPEDFCKVCVGLRGGKRLEVYPAPVSKSDPNKLSVWLPQGCDFPKDVKSVKVWATQTADDDNADSDWDEYFQDDDDDDHDDDDEDSSRDDGKSSKVSRYLQSWIGDPSVWWLVGAVPAVALVIKLAISKKK